NKKRADIVIFSGGMTDEEKKNQHNIRIIIECKKEAVKPTDKDNGIEQLKAYMAACVNCEWGMWTNGLHKTVYRKVTDEQNQTVFEEYNDIPSADGTTDEQEHPIHNIIYVNEGLQKQPAFFEFLKIIFCKIFCPVSVRK
ncbi:hypothetical protein EZS27_031402, partial [termite gut metagenome]